MADIDRVESELNRHLREIYGQVDDAYVGLKQAGREDLLPRLSELRDAADRAVDWSAPSR